jgi:hypothetical protein
MTRYKFFSESLTIENSNFCTQFLIVPLKLLYSHILDAEAPQCEPSIHREVKGDRQSKCRKCSPRRKAVKKVKGHFRRKDDQFVRKMTKNLDMSCTSLWNWRRRKTKNSRLSRESQSCKSAKMLTPLCLVRYWSYNLFRRETIFTARDSHLTTNRVYSVTLKVNPKEKLAVERYQSDSSIKC